MRELHLLDHQRAALRLALGGAALACAATSASCCASTIACAARDRRQRIRSGRHAAIAAQIAIRSRIAS